jgi:hypothetical protein
MIVKFSPTFQMFMWHVIWTCVFGVADTLAQSGEYLGLEMKVLNIHLS